MRALVLALTAFVGLALPARADTTTARLGLVLPSTGSLNWGLKTNDWMVKLDTGAAGLKVSNTFIAGSTNTFKDQVLFSSTVVMEASTTLKAPLLIAASTGVTGFAVKISSQDGTTMLGLQGNGQYTGNFNAALQLVRMDAAAKLPAIDGSQLTNLPSAGEANTYTSTKTFTDVVAIGGVSTGGGTLVVKSTSTTSNAPIVDFKNNAGTSIFKVTQAGNATLTANGTLSIGYIRRSTTGNGSNPFQIATCTGTGEVVVGGGCQFSVTDCGASNGPCVGYPASDTTYRCEQGTTVAGMVSWAICARIAN